MCWIEDTNGSVKTIQAEVSLSLKHLAAVLKIRELYKRNIGKDVLFLQHIYNKASDGNEICLEYQSPSRLH